MRARTRCASLAASILMMVGVSEARADFLFGLTNGGNTIFAFDSANPQKILSAKLLTNVAPTVSAITSRRSTSQMYGLFSGGIVGIDTLTGNTFFGTNNSNLINGTAFGIDFDPTTNDSMLRVTSDTGINYHYNVPSAPILDNFLSYQNGDPHAGQSANIVAIAYTNEVAGASTTTLYGIDSNFDTLVKFVGNASSGQLATVGSLGLNVTNVAGLDISSSGTMYAALQTVNSGISNLYTIDPNSGGATLVGQIGGGMLVQDLTLANGVPIPPVPEPASLVIFALLIPVICNRRMSTR